ncbi:MAG: molybdopterin-dependent oxidoreductase [Myxococcales bacterium]|nr:molybdopterin-dependent oxidoreductase [Myxococcales bacterium]
MAIEDMEHSRFIVLWGINPSATGIHTVPVIERARAQGAKLVVIDPRRIPLAARADFHLAPLPGTDLPLALAMANYMFEHGLSDAAFLDEHVSGVAEFRARAAAWPLARAVEVTGVAAEDIAAVARAFATTKPAMIRCGYGVERNRNGGSAAAAILALPALVGAFGAPGAGFLMSNGKADWGVSAEGGIAEPLPAPSTTRQLNMVALGEALTQWQDPPVRVLFNYNCNALATAPDQEAVRRGLASRDVFVVVHDQIMTDTAHYADVVLPATSFLEHREVRRGYGNMRLFDSEPAVAPFGQSRSNNQMFAELLGRFDLVRGGDAMTDEDLVDAIFAASPRGERLKQAIARDGVATPVVANPVLFAGALPKTPSGKIELVPAGLDAAAPGGLYHYRSAQDVDAAATNHPFTLISPALSTQITSTFGQLREHQVPVQIAPSDAAAHGIADGDEVLLQNELGVMRAICEVASEVRPGVLVAPKGMWAKHSRNGRTTNALVPATLTDLGGGACYNDARVSIRKA